MLPTEDRLGSDHSLFYDQIRAVAGEEYDELCILKKEGWASPKYDEHFAQQRETADNANMKLCLAWYKKMTRILQEVDRALNVVPASSSFEFLDLGCSPGGFSKYMLDKNIYAHGIGISLPPASGGHEHLLPQQYGARHRLIEADMTAFNLSNRSQLSGGIKYPTLPPGVLHGQFDLVVCDGHPLRTHVDPPPGNSDRLLISQIIIALQCVKPGGSILMKLSHPERLLTAQLMSMFDQVSREVVGVLKPETMHGTRGTFYIVSRSVGEDDFGAWAGSHLQSFKSLWEDLSFGGVNGKGRCLKDGDLDFIASVERMVERDVLEWIVEVGGPVWRTQKKHLERLAVKLRSDNKSHTYARHF